MYVSEEKAHGLQQDVGLLWDEDADEKGDVGDSIYSNAGK